MSFTYTEAKRAHLAGELDLAADDIRVLLVMADSSANAERNVTTLAGFTTLDEMDAGGYARMALASPSVTTDPDTHEAIFDGDAVEFFALPNGSRPVKGALIYKHGADDANSMPIRYVDDGGFPVSPAGANLKIRWPADGILRLD